MPRGVTDEDLSGPTVDRRTMMKLMGAGGASMAVAGCTSNPGATDQTTTGGSVGGGTLQAAWFIDEITDLDPVVNSTGTFEQLSMNLYSGLLRTTKNFELQGDIAKDWTVSDKAQTYEFTLREDAQFQGDFGNIKAKDVQDVIARGLNEDGSTSKPKLEPIKSPVRGTGVEVLGDYKVRINLKKPFKPFIKALSKAGGACNLHPVAAVEEMGRESFKTKPVGSGPFRVTEHQVGQRVVLKPHEGYHRTTSDGTQLPLLDEVVVEPVPDAATLVNALKGGDVQFANSVPFANLKQLQNSQAVNTLDAPAAGWIAIYLNPNKEVFDSAKKRRGIAKIFDSKSFVEETFFGNQLPAVGPIGPAHGPFYRPFEEKPDFQKYDPEKGEQLLEETGIKGSSITLHTRDSTLRRARGYKNQLSSHFDVTLEPVDTSTYLDLLDGVRPSSDKEAYFAAGWGSDIDIAVDTTTYFFFKDWEEGGAFNDMIYQDDDVDQWLEEQRQTVDQQKRVELFHKIEDRVMKDSPCIFSHHIVPWQATGGDIQGYTPHPFRRDFENIRLP